MNETAVPEASGGVTGTELTVGVGSSSGAPAGPDEAQADDPTTASANRT